uniref:Uncharacterized protein n=1 Tax=Arundo donax TaxID=35708 RepID=A0A0A8ZF33_ARUDO
MYRVRNVMTSNTKIHKTLQCDDSVWDQKEAHHQWHEDEH